MKSPLRVFQINRHEPKTKRDRHPPAKLDELVQASEDMKDMRNFYDSLLSAAAATANGVYEFSEALEEMGMCLLEKTALNDDENSGRVLMMLGKAQFELQKLVDSYRANIVQTITTPSESLLKELQTVEEMKRQCDDKREYYNLMLAAHRDKGRSRHSKSENFSQEQLKAALTNYQDEAALFVFRLKSLKQGQFRSLLTQAARHHAAQLSFFRKGLKCLEAVEPHVKAVAEQQHIDYQFSGLEDDDDSENDDDDDDYYGNDQSDDGELSFDYEIEERDRETLTSRKSMEVDLVNHTIAPESLKEHKQENIDKSQADFFTLKVKPGVFSQSTPIFPDTKFEPSEKRQMQTPSTRKSYSYILPTPVDDKNSASTGANSTYYSGRLESKGGGSTNLWHSSPLNFKDSKIVGGLNSVPSHADRQSPPLPYPQAASDFKKFKRDAFSGPIPSKTLSGKPMFSIADHRPTMDYHRVVSATPRVPASQSSVSQASSKPLRRPISSPKISELHELPRPPVNLEPTRPSNLVGYSGPLISRRQVLVTTSKVSPALPYTASPLPAPPVSMTRSYSIPSSSQRMAVFTAAKLLEAPHNPETNDQVASPPLTPISLTNLPRASESTTERHKD
ncbi:uncharacterized protein At2g33490-like [Typha angustifolia]|uniref:uncharacterized protein At2g33490-like n=1 Tax=Typha angustifolia TaxID=59011 RepID=UPI003C30B3E7